ncbi:MAG: hypothetical protein K9G76_02225 [Bacteroidales bacterium]|nr:hypothetical protein [Bacteroidales bacterium]MCF8404866.1 hypothetical protein [Bacteroidales bacterium]
MAVIRETHTIKINNLTENYYILLNALNGSTQDSSYFDIDGKLTLLNNLTNKGLLGNGEKLKGKKIIIKSNLENNTPNVDNDEDQITCEYLLSSAEGNKLIYKYDKPETDDDYPTVKLTIIFE